MANLVAFAQAIGLRVYLPQPVERELEEQFVRDYSTAVEKLRSQEKGVAQHLDRALVGAPKVSMLAEGDVRAAFRDAVANAKHVLGFTDSPASERPAVEFFEMAIKKAPPFDQQGRGAPDAHIASAVIDHARATGEISILVSADRDYSGIEALARDNGAVVFALKDEDALASLRRRLSAKYQKIMAEEETAARQLVEQEQANIEAFISKTVRFPDRALVPFGYTARRIADIRLTDIKQIQSVPPFGSQAEANEVQLTIEVRRARGRGRRSADGDETHPDPQRWGRTARRESLRNRLAYALRGTDQPSPICDQDGRVVGNRYED